MSDITQPQIALQPEKPPAATLGAIGWLRGNLFNSIPNTLLTLFALYLIVELVPPLFRWMFIDSTWIASSGKDCRASAGACWAFIGEWYRFILFGRFPYAEQWRPLLVIVIFIAMFLASCDRRLWGGRLIAIWIGGGALALALMFGGFLGMTYVETSLWNGLPLTLILAVFGMLFAFPLAILLALGRRSRMPAVHSLSVAYIELIRGVPLITILFMASVMLPLFLPSGTTIDKLLRAQIAIILFAGAYLAEVVRGGLQALPKGQYEGADSLGLTYWQKTRLIILPQALRLVIPPLVNTFIGFFKDTSLVLIIGIFDLLTAAKTAIVEPAWQSFGLEVFIVAALIYFMFCFAMSRYSQQLEAELNRTTRH